MEILKTVVTLCILCITAATHLTSHGKDINKKPATSLYIDDVHIVDVNTGRVIENRQLHISNGKIVAINPAHAPIISQNVIQFDGQGRYVVPGLIDMHVHAYDPAAFIIALSHGVTHMRLMNGVKPHLRWREELEQGERVGSTITVSSPIISGFNHAPMHHSAQTPAEATEAVIKAKQQGYDLIKAYGNLTAPVLTALLREAKQQNMPVAKHGPHPVIGLEWNALMGSQSLEHVEDIYQGPLNHRRDQQQLGETIAKLKALDTPITSTLNIFWQLTQISEQKQAYVNALPKNYISPIIAMESTQNEVKRWLKSPIETVEHNKNTLAFLLDITRQLYQADITLLVGSDSGVLLSPHGLATHKEMHLMQQAGLPAIAVLRAATINAAKTLKKETQLGQIKVGHNADLILSKNNPLETLITLQHPDAVVKNGKLFSRRELEQLRESAIDERSIWQELDTLRQAW